MRSRRDLGDQMSGRGSQGYCTQVDFVVVGCYLEDRNEGVLWASEMILDCPVGVWKEAHAFSVLCS